MADTVSRTLAIGDVHGCLTALDTLLGFVELRPTDQLIFLGDYVDRGPDSKGVLDRLIELRRLHEVVFLRGNHEVMMANAGRGQEVVDDADQERVAEFAEQVEGVQLLPLGRRPGR